VYISFRCMAALCCRMRQRDIDELGALLTEKASYG
jgi:hypothetical protein